MNKMKMKKINLYVNERQLAIVKSYCKIYGKTISDVYRHAVDMFLMDLIEQMRSMDNK